MYICSLLLCVFPVPPSKLALGLCDQGNGLEQLPGPKAKDFSHTGFCIHSCELELCEVCVWESQFIDVPLL